jgi:hypothetical protein
VDRRTDVLIHMQQALLGEVFSALRAVDVNWTESSLHFIGYIDGDISEEDEESLSCIETELITAFSEDHEIGYDSMRIDFPDSLPQQRGQACVYSRREYE